MSTPVLHLFMVMVVTVMLTSTVRASVINCPPNAMQDQLEPSLKQLCYAIERAVEELPQQLAMNARLDEANMLIKKSDESNRIAKDHEFLRFGRRFGL